jgi:hypothetical protein
MIETTRLKREKILQKRNEENTENCHIDNFAENDVLISPSSYINNSI